MNFTVTNLNQIHPNPNWAALPLFDRKGWKRVRFGDVVENVNDTVRSPLAEGIDRVIAMEHLEPGSLHVREWGRVEDGTTFTRRCRPGQVLFGKRRAYQRKVAVAEFDAVVYGDIYVLAPKSNRLLPELLPFLCMSERFFQHAVGTSAGSLSPRTNWSSLASFEFALPPLDQQRRLAEILWAVDEVIQKCQKIVANCQSLRNRCLDRMLSDHSVVWTRVGDVSKFTSGKLIAVTGLAQTASGQSVIPVHGGNGISGFTDNALISDRTIIIGRVGQFCGCVSITDGPSWITDNALMAAHIDATIDLEFLALCLEGCKLNHRKIGNYLPLINQQVVHSTEIPLPEITAQRDFVYEIHQLDESISCTLKHIATLQQLIVQLCQAILG